MGSASFREELLSLWGKRTFQIKPGFGTNRGQKCSPQRPRSTRNKRRLRGETDFSAISATSAVNDNSLGLGRASEEVMRSRRKGMTYAGRFLLLLIIGAFFFIPGLGRADDAPIMSRGGAYHRKALIRLFVWTLRT